MVDRDTDSVATMVRALANINEQMRMIKAKQDKELAALRKSKRECEAYLMGKLKELGPNTRGLDTEFGRVTLRKTTRYTPVDWSRLYEFITKNDCYEFLVRRVNNQNIKKYLLEHGADGQDEATESYMMGLKEEDIETLSLTKAKGE
jgi:tRNA nucleotidyltransferase/poly(A) polymerase